MLSTVSPVMVGADAASPQPTTPVSDSRRTSTLSAWRISTPAMWTGFFIGNATAIGSMPVIFMDGFHLPVAMPRPRRRARATVADGRPRLQGWQATKRRIPGTSPGTRVSRDREVARRQLPGRHPRQDERIAGAVGDQRAAPGRHRMGEHILGIRKGAGREDDGVVVGVG